MVDRLADLGVETGVDDDGTLIAESAGNAEIAEHMQLYEPIKKELLKIQQNVRDIEKLKDKDRTVANEKERKDNMDRLEAVMGETTKIGRQIKAQLDKIRADNISYKQKNSGDSAKSQARDNLYSTNIRKFHAVMNEYNSASYDYKQGLQERTRRQLKIVDSSITDEEVEKIVQSGQAQGVISKALISENLQDTIRDIEERHHDIMKLEQQVLEVYELFKDLATLVDLQQESLDVIENRITNAKAYAIKAEDQLMQAEGHQKKARRKKCCLLVVLLVIVVIMLSAIIANAVKGS